jgi:hypothetical protein
MKKRKRVFVFVPLVLVIALAMAPVAEGVVTFVGGTQTISANVSDIVVVTVYSNTANTTWNWGVYLRGNPSNADLTGAAVLAAAGSQRSVTLTDPSGYDGDNYLAQGTGGSRPAVGNWSTVNFQGLAAGTYYVDLYDYTTNGGSYSNPPTVTNTKTFTVVPEPVTITLLGLGGLFLLRQRRRK